MTVPDTTRTDDGPADVSADENVEFVPASREGDRQIEAQAGPKNLYYFDGESGCDRCVATTGYYLASIPPRPHPYCVCSVTLLDALSSRLPFWAHGDLRDGTCQLLILNVQWGTNTTSTVTSHRYINHGSYSTPTGGGAAPNVVQQWDPGLEAAAKQAGWSPPAIQSLRYAFTIPPNRVAIWEVEVERAVQHIQGDLYLSCQDGYSDGRMAKPNTFKKVGVLHGRYAVNVNVSHTILDMKKFRQYGP